MSTKKKKKVTSPAIQAINELIGLIQKHINMDKKRQNKNAKKRNKSKKEKKHRSLIFCNIGLNRISFGGCPTAKVLQSWYDNYGITDVVTLIRKDERNCINILNKCKLLNIECHHLPITGAKRFASVVKFINNDIEYNKNCENENNMRSIKKLKNIIDILKTNDKITRRSVIVHCSAGLHRTGLAMYLILRGLGYKSYNLNNKNNSESALSEIQQIRLLTYQEMLKRRKWFRNVNIIHLVQFSEALFKHLKL